MTSAACTIVYSFTSGQLSDTAANFFIKHMANGIFATVCTSWVFRELFNNSRNQIAYIHLDLA